MSTKLLSSVLQPGTLKVVGTSLQKMFLSSVCSAVAPRPASDRWLKVSFHSFEYFTKPTICLFGEFLRVLLCLSCGEFDGIFLNMCSALMTLSNVSGHLLFSYLFLYRHFQMIHYLFHVTTAGSQFSGVMLFPNLLPFAGSKKRTNTVLGNCFRPAFLSFEKEHR